MSRSSSTCIKTASIRRSEGSLSNFVMANLRHDESETLGEDISAEAQILTRLSEIAAQLGENAIAVDAQQLMTRIGEGRFFVACIGQFKRGKSTLLNALVGDAVLPTGVVPVTAVPTVLRYGEQRAARVLIDGSWRAVSPDDLAQYVSEELNPENAKVRCRRRGSSAGFPAGQRHVPGGHARNWIGVRR